jgi:hypothetical protein
LTGAGAEDGPEAAYRREEELENARKGGENDFDPEGILDLDDEMEISVEDKETQTGILKKDVADRASQATLKAGCNGNATAFVMVKLIQYQSILKHNFFIFL